MKKCFVLLLASLYVMSCLTEIDAVSGVEDVQNRTATVRFFPEVCKTKSSIEPDETQITSLNVLAFRDGVLIGEVFVEQTEEAVMELPVGYSYNVYALANVGKCEKEVSETEFAEALTYSIEEISDLSGPMPMSCFLQDVHVGRSGQSVTLTMERMVSRLVLSVDRSSLLEGLSICSVRLCQSASVVRPFKWQGCGGSRAESVQEVIDGDWATESDLARLNSGGDVIFYALENCQGVLLPDNVDPFLKVPAKVDDKKDLCTYFEITCAFDGTGLLGGDVTYRIYVGLDDCRSFDVPGNSCINVRLSLTGEGLKKVSWKVEADVHVMDGYALGKVSRGIHGMSELYVGEMIQYQVEFSDELMEYLGGSASGSTLRLVKDGTMAAGLVTGMLNGAGNVLKADMLCMSPTDGELILYSPDGEPLVCLERDVNVAVPQIVIAEYAEWQDDEPVERLSFIPECEVNGAMTKLYVYFTDVAGYNLNGYGAYDFDPGLFRLQDGGAFAGSKHVQPVTATFSMLPKVPGRAAASMDVKCGNDGSDHDINLLLSELYAAQESFRTNVKESNFGIETGIEVGLGIPQIGLTLVDNGWAGYHDSQLSVVVDNPSNLPLNVSVWQLVATNSASGQSDPTYVEDNLQIDEIQYMTGSYYNGEPPFYGSYSRFCSERNDSGDDALSMNGMLIYPLSGISTADIRKAVSYGKRGAGQMIHMVDAGVAGRRLFNDDVALYDNVSDGSATYDYIYYSDDSWKYRGAVLFSDGNAISNSGYWRHDYPNVCPLAMDRLLARFRDEGAACVEFLYAPNYGKLSVMTYVGVGSQYDLMLSLEYEGTMNGYVQTYPKGTWYAAQDNFCHVGFFHEKSGVPLRPGGQFVWADDGQLKSAMDGIYEFSYKDSPRPLGADAYMHNAHPVDVVMDVRMLVEGDKGQELYPYYVRWENDFLEYFHVQEDKTYKCEVDADSSGYLLRVVTHK